MDFITSYFYIYIYIFKSWTANRNKAKTWKQPNRHPDTKM